MTFGIFISISSSNLFLQVTVVGIDGRLVYESLVNPENDIIDYNTRLLELPGCFIFLCNIFMMAQLSFIISFSHSPCQSALSSMSFITASSCPPIAALKLIYQVLQFNLKFFRFSGITAKDLNRGQTKTIKEQILSTENLRIEADSLASLLLSEIPFSTDYNVRPSPVRFNSVASLRTYRFSEHFDRFY